MKGLEIKKRRIVDSVQLMDIKKVRFFTLTTPDCVDLSEIRRRWRKFRHYLVEKLGSVQYIMNYEQHPGGHGWHIHVLINRFVDLRDVLLRSALIRSGFGRVDISSAHDTFSLSEYVAKHCIKSYRQSDRMTVRRLRLINCSRGLYRLSDFEYQSQLEDSVKQVYKLVSASCLFRQFSPLVIYRASKKFVMFKPLNVSFEDCLYMSQY